MELLRVRRQANKMKHFIVHPPSGLRGHRFPLDGQLSILKVSFVENHEHVYDIAPEMKVLGSGFQALTDSGLEILFEGDSFYAHIITEVMESYTDMDFDQWRERPFFESEISSDTVITLKLLGNHTRWALIPASLSSRGLGQGERCRQQLCCIRQKASLLYSRGAIHRRRRPTTSW